MLTAECHCAAIRIHLPGAPPTVTDCNCSICRRYGALWAYYTRDQVEIEAAPGATAAYRWGDRTIEFCHCSRCGCLTHYESVDKHGRHRLAVNARMLPREVLATLPVRHFDGAESWEYLD